MLLEYDVLTKFHENCFVYKHTLEISKCTKRGKRKERNLNFTCEIKSYIR